MEKKKIDIIAVAKDGKKNAATFLGKAKGSIIQIVDQNDDGSFDMSDVTSIADTIGSAAKNRVNAMVDSAEAKKREKDQIQLRPIFVDDIQSPDFALTRLIRITEMDKRRAESEVCKGSIGYIYQDKDIKVINIFRDKVDEFGLSFYPDTDGEVYYIDPCDRDHYIELDKYFNYLKIVRVNELQKIAQDLGAVHFRVIYKEKNSSYSEKETNVKEKLKIAGRSESAGAEKDYIESQKTSMEIAAENIFPGHAPVAPQLHYLMHEPSIQSLITMRMDSSSPMLHQTLSIVMSNSTGIKEKDGAKIDATLKSMRVEGSISIAGEIRKEAHRCLEFEVDF